MTNIHSMFLFEHQFDEFLCASIGEEKNGMALSVLSAFARRNVDPWQEAARLSLAEFSPGAPGPASPREIAERLMAPLPHSNGSAASQRKTFLGRAALTRRRNRENHGGSSFSFVLAGVRGDRAAVCQTHRGTGVRRNRKREMTLGIGHLQPIAGALILIMPRQAISWPPF